MTDQEFFQLRDHYFNQESPFISKEFCDKFLERLPDEQNIIQDYHSWGKSLFGDIYKDAEQEIHQLKLWLWIELYENIESKGIEEVVDIIGEATHNDADHYFDKRDKETAEDPDAYEDDDDKTYDQHQGETHGY